VRLSRVTDRAEERERAPSRVISLSLCPLKRSRGEGGEGEEDGRWPRGNAFLRICLSGGGISRHPSLAFFFFLSLPVRPKSDSHRAAEIYGAVFSLFLMVILLVFKKIYIYIL
jgi:hypothetical protein